MFGAGNNNNYEGGSPRQSYGNKNGEGQNQQRGGADRETKPIRPITIRQLVTSDKIGEGVAAIDGREIDKVTIVGRVINTGMFSGLNDQQNQSMAQLNAFLEFIVTDGTGKIIVKHYKKKDVPVPEIEINQWVSATGTIKHVNSKFTLNGAISLIDDQNEVIYHFLDAILTHRRIGLAQSNLADIAIPEDTFKGYAAGLRREKDNNGKAQGLLPIPSKKGNNADGSPSASQRANNNNNNNAGGGGLSDANKNLMQGSLFRFFTSTNGSPFNTDQALNGIAGNLNFNISHDDVVSALKNMVAGKLCEELGNDYWKYIQ